eukprot:640230-Rhodomonas_salina.1
MTGITPEWDGAGSYSGAAARALSAPRNQTQEPAFLCDGHASRLIRHSRAGVCVSGTYEEARDHARTVGAQRKRSHHRHERNLAHHAAHCGHASSAERSEEEDRGGSEEGGGCRSLLRALETAECSLASRAVHHMPPVPTLLVAAVRTFGAGSDQRRLRGVGGRWQLVGGPAAIEGKAVPDAVTEGTCKGRRNQGNEARFWSVDKAMGLVCVVTCRATCGRRPRTCRSSGWGGKRL